MTSLVTWIGFNDWDVEKSYDKIATAIVIPFEAYLGDTDLEKEPDKPVSTDTEPEPKPKPEPDLELEVPKIEDKAIYIEGQKLPSEPTLIKGVLIANKQHPLPKDYKPGESEEARKAFSEMAAEALLDNFKLEAFSTYRSYDYQVDLYKRYVERDGEEAADRYSARPGYSEHQTGLAFDIGEVNGKEHYASSSFGDTEAGKWIATNAYRFGFIMRYPEGKEKITGYMFESWHFRYVGLEIAKEIYQADSTLEEYLGL